MGILDKFKELKAITNLIDDNELRGKKIYFDEDTFYVNEKYEKIYLLYIQLYPYLYSNSIVFELEINNTIKRFTSENVPHPLITLAYLKLQKYIREFNQQ